MLNGSCEKVETNHKIAFEHNPETSPNGYAKNDMKNENDVYGTSGRLGHKNPQETINSYLEIVQEGFDDYVEDSFLKNLTESDDYG